MRLRGKYFFFRFNSSVARSFFHGSASLYLLLFPAIAADVDDAAADGDDDDEFLIIVNS